MTPGRPPDVAGAFVVARNPEEGSKLGYLISLPLPEGPLVLKAGDTWPRTAKVYCHPAGGWPDDPVVVETIPVRDCRRRGVAIDLVLDRGRENRSQVIFTTLRDGRPAIFWQSARTTAKARPGVRIPTRRASGHAALTILVDTRERYPYRFSGQQATVERRALPAGDYGVALPGPDDGAGGGAGGGGEVVAVVERKSLADLAGRLSDGQLAFALAELATVGRAAVVVEDRYSKLFKLEHTSPGFILDQLARAQARYPSVPIVFAETRPLAEEWTFRFLGAALAETLAERESTRRQ